MKKNTTAKMTEQEAREKLKKVLGKNTPAWMIDTYLTSWYYNPLYAGIFTKKAEG
jgi:hypothetical protein